MGAEHRWDVADATWTAPAGTAWLHAVVYEEVTKRDWRWLWLRRKTTVTVVWHGEPSQGPEGKNQN